MGTDGDLTWHGEHRIQCMDGVFLSCALVICIILLTTVILINSMNKEIKNKISKQNRNILMNIRNKRIVSR